jgi:hypothetical protein
MKTIGDLVNEIKLVFTLVIYSNKIKFAFNDERVFKCSSCGVAHKGSFIVNDTPVAVCWAKRTIKVFGSGIVIPDKPVRSWKIVRAVYVPPVTVHDTCQALTKRGIPCKNRPKHGSDLCGPHSDQLE